MTPEAVIFIQARLTSERLPGKILLDLGGKKVIDRVYEACSSVASTVVAIPDTQANNELADYLSTKQVPLFRGPEHDVLKRFYQCWEAVGRPKNVVRITADCPLIIPDLIKLVLRYHAAKGQDYTSFCSGESRGVVSGLDVEVFTGAALEETNAEAVKPYEREHVTPWMQQNLTCAFIRKLSLDTEEDYALLKELF